MSKARADRRNKIAAFAAELDTKIQTELAAAVAENRPFELEIPTISKDTEFDKDWAPILDPRGLWPEFRSSTARISMDSAKVVTEHRATYDAIVAHEAKMIAEARRAHIERTADVIMVQANMKSMLRGQDASELAEAIIKRVRQMVVPSE
jgi:DNA-binding GntR family transcriptional regulator